MRPSKRRRALFWVFDRITALFGGTVPPHWLTVVDQESGLLQSVTVGLYEFDGRTYVIDKLPSRHGWASNARASGRGTLTAGRTDTDVTLTEVIDPAMKDQVITHGTRKKGPSRRVSSPISGVFEVTLA